MEQESVYLKKPWLRSYEEGVPEFIAYREICLPEILDETAARFGPNDCLIFQGTRVSFAAFKDMVDRFAACLTDFGIKKGDAVAILLPNIIPCVAAYYAILKIGAIAVMNNPLYSDPELEHQFNDSGSKVLVTLDVLAKRMIDLRPKTGIRQIVTTCIGDYLPPLKRVLGRWLKKYPFADVPGARDVYSWLDCLKRYPPLAGGVKSSFDDVAMYQYTGGTTGVSKGVMLTHGNLSKQVQQLEAWFPKLGKGGEIMLGALPYFHVFGLSVSMNFSIYMGWAQILIPRPQPEPLLEAIRNFRPTFAPLVPTMYIGMLNHPDLKKTDMSCIKGAFSGSAPLPVEVIHNFEKATGAVIVEGFGMTETTPVTHVNPFAGGARKVGSIGVPISDTLCRIVDLETGTRDMPVGEAGELIIKGPQVMKGYKDRPEETASALRDGWMYTGDIATMDEDGYFYIVDRKKDMIISGGYNVYPRDIDEVYYQHPKIQEACAIGIPDPRRGESVKLFVVLKEGETATQEELIEYGRTKLAAYKLPVEVEFRKELPKTNVGKVLRKQLRAEEMERRKA
ncbi:MAG TPA: long-chain fatty acid--CoA ligase [Syntrophales bacterium]|nr:long-chain fatty acid--CoA ligase [Syntrophales bacterium]HOO00664.1 long-chain fatty acid--CoA ligase [Syntrophales bacterium]HPC01993.1 long-chain fatty acid--CoA ligase [Syntrophales bacterium]